MTSDDPRNTGKNSSPSNANDTLTAGPEQSEVDQAKQHDGQNGGEQGSQGRKSLVPTLSLPKGGGAIGGIGEKFNVNPATGTGGLSIPIATTQGRSGFGPELTLSYDSGAGNGPFGLGWGLSVPNITRKTNKGLPRYRTGEEEDTFVLSGAEDLVPTLEYNSTENKWEAYERTEGNFKVRRYRPRVEGTFARIEQWTSTTNGSIYWKATTPGNVTSTYGESSSAQICDPTQTSHVFSWLLEKTEDDRGNVILYQHESEDLENVPISAHETHRKKGTSQIANRYLKRILYGNRQMNIGTLPEHFFFEAVFDYGEHATVPEVSAAPGVKWPCRLDPFSTYRAGFEVRTYRLCRRVLMFHRFVELESSAAPRLVRSTEINYDENAVLTKLTSVVSCGYSKEGVNPPERHAMPSLDLSYSEVQIDSSIKTLDKTSLENLPDGLATPGCQLVDLDGEGAAGVLCEQGGGWTYKPNLGPQWQSDGSHGTARFGASRNVSEIPARNPVASGFQLMDLGGDGKLDLVQLSGQTAGYSARTPEGKWEPWRYLKTRPNVDLQSPNTQIVDLTGDGFGDVVVGEDSVFLYYPSKGRDGFDVAQWARKASEESKGPQVLSSVGQEVVAFADICGDGLSDIVRIRNREVCYWPNLGYGRFGAKIVMSGFTPLDEGSRYDPQRVKLADIDGSGTTDIIYLHAKGPKLYLNQAGNSFSSPQQLSCFAVGDKHRQVQVADILGTGTSQLVWSSPLASDAYSPLRYIDLMSEGKPHLLREVENNLGAITRIRYTPSTKFYLEDKAAEKPWITRMAFPVHVVERVETYDGVSKTRLINTYRYRHGYFDGHEREFRGFAYVEQHDSASISTYGADGLFDEHPPEGGVDDESHLPPVVTKSWFHTGAWLDRQDISLALAAEYYTPSWSAPKLSDTVLPTELPSGVLSLSIIERREACRALKGQILRQEVYAEDGATEEVHPYSVTESNASLRLLQPQLEQRHAVFSVAAGEAMSMHFERDSEDPRVSHALTLEVDDYGNVLRSAQVGYPSQVSSGHDAEQLKLWILVNDQDVFNSPSDATSPSNPTTWYRVGVPVESKTYELTLKSSFTPIPTITTPLTISGLKQVIEDILAEQDQPNVIAYEATSTNSENQLRVVKHVRQIYTDDNQTGAPLPLGNLESLALPWCSYSLAFTGGIVESGGVFGSRVSVESTPGTTDILSTDGGYVAEDVAAGNQSGTPVDTSWWLPSERQTYSASGFYLPVSVIDPFDITITITYDEPSGTIYYLLPATVTSQVSSTETNTVSTEIDYRVMAPDRIKDENDKVTSVKFDALGMVVATAQMGKSLPGDTWEGDTLDSPTTILSYDLTQWEQDQKPAFIYAKARETHKDSNTDWIETYSYSDGLGREVMKKVLAEQGLAPYRDAQGEIVRDQEGNPILQEAVTRWVGTGRTVFDNKGNPIKQYEPFFSNTSEYEDEEDLVQWGVTPILRYDPLGRLIRTDSPNGTHSKVVFDAWEQETWDENDTVLDTDWYTDRQALSSSEPEHRASELAADHAGTPTINRLDSLGRPYLTRQDNGTSTSHSYVDTNVSLDIEGLQLSVTDALSRTALSTDYDVLGRPIHTSSIDAGERWMLVDAVDQEVYAWDSRAYMFKTSYDYARRPTHRRVDNGTTVELLEEMIYGEGQTSDKDNNLRGRAFRYYDGAGLLQNSTFDFKGNLLKTSRTLVADAQIVPNWSASPTMEDVVYTTDRTYDALNRVVTERIPDDPDPAATANCTVTKYTYNEAGLLDKVDAQVRGAMTAPPNPEAIWTPIVANIDYNARGQREEISYGCGASPGDVDTTYTYDKETFRLTQLKTVRTSSTDLQNLNYTYDPVGNIVQVVDAAQQTVYFNYTPVIPDSKYEYDAMYRLTMAEGREHPGQTTNQPNHTDCALIQNLPDPQNPNNLQHYAEEYSYDAVGNITQMRHRSIGSSQWSWTRDYTYDSASNKMLSNNAPTSGTDSYTYDNHGNMTSMPHLPQMHWDPLDQLQKVFWPTNLNAVYFQYDGSGQRVRKVYTHGSTTDTRIYLGSYEIFQSDNGGLKLERQTVHINAGDRRVAIIETRTIDVNDSNSVPDTRYRYQLDNHLGTACVELDKNGLVITYEEYHPYGTTAYHAVGSAVQVSTKRYRYTGKERDEETGLYYHGARYYAAWLGRWTATDPAGMIDGVCLFVYVSNNPLGAIDLSGTDAGSPTLKNQMEQDTRSLGKGTGALGLLSPTAVEKYGRNRDFNHPFLNRYEKLTGGHRKAIAGSSRATRRIAATATTVASSLPVGAGAASVGVSSAVGLGTKGAAFALSNRAVSFALANPEKAMAVFGLLVGLVDPTPQGGGVDIPNTPTDNIAKAGKQAVIRGAGEVCDRGESLFVAILGLAKSTKKSSAKGGETIVRRTNAAEAVEMMTEGGLVPKPGSKGPKWVTVGKKQDTLPSKGHEKTVTMEVEKGTVEWLRSKSADFARFSGEKALPAGVLKKSNEPGALGIGVDLLPDFNSKVKSVSVK